MKIQLSVLAAFVLLVALTSQVQAAATAPFVVLIPGAGSSGSTIAGFPKIIGNHYFGLYQSLLAKAGVHTIICPTTLDDDTRSLEDRAIECSQQIQAEEMHQPCTARNVVVVGHSMGGLVARLLAHDEKIAGCLSSILTLATPHQGTQLADFAIDHQETPHGLIGEILKGVGFTNAHHAYLGEMRADHSQDPANEFVSQTIADNPEIAYSSISDSFKYTPMPLQTTKDILSALLRKQGADQTSWGDRNDGIVPEYSQIHGTYLGHLEINHWQMACVDPMKATPGCHKAAAFIIPIVQTLVQTAKTATP